MVGQCLNLHHFVVLDEHLQRSGTLEPFYVGSERGRVDHIRAVGLSVHNFALLACSIGNTACSRHGYKGC